MKNINHYFDLSYRSLIVLGGGDALEFLQGQITNDINQLAQKNMIYALFLTPQGKIITDVFITSNKGEILLDICHNSHELMLKRLQMYSIGREVEVVDHRDDKAVVVTADLGGADPRSSTLSFTRMVVDRGELEAKAKKENRSEIYEKYRQELLSHKIPELDGDFVAEKFFPSDFDMEDLNAISYEKGCYVGQEVTARVKYRGIKRKSLEIIGLAEYQVAAVEGGAGAAASRSTKINQFGDKILVLKRN